MSPTAGVILAAVLAAVGLVWLGYAMASAYLSAIQANVTRERQALRAEWRALEETARVRAIFLNARRAMQREADGQSPDGTGE